MADKTYKHAALLNQLDHMQRVSYLKSYHGFIRQAELVITQLEDEVREMTRANEDKTGVVPTPVELIAWARACRKQGFHTNLGHIADALEAALAKTKDRAAAPAFLAVELPELQEVVGYYCNKCGKFPASSEHDGCGYLAVGVPRGYTKEETQDYARQAVAAALAKQAAQAEIVAWLYTDVQSGDTCADTDPDAYTQEVATDYKRKQALVLAPQPATLRSLKVTR